MNVIFTASNFEEVDGTVGFTSRIAFAGVTLDVVSGNAGHYTGARIYRTRLCGWIAVG